MNKIVFAVAVLVTIAQPFAFYAQTPDNNLPVIDIGKALDSKAVAPLSSVASKLTEESNPVLVTVTIL